MTLRGTPDYFLCLNGHFVALELKSDESIKAEPLQEHMMNKIAHAGGVVYLVSPQNWDAVFSELELLAKTPARKIHTKYEQKH